MVAVRKAARTTPGAVMPGQEFLMVHNRRRDGWELPGGRCEEGEEPLECARREFLEETGRSFRRPRLAQRRTGNLGEGYVFVVEPLKRSRRPEDLIDGVRFFDVLPPREKLAFPDDPYPELFNAARAILEEARKARRGGLRTKPK